MVYVKMCVLHVMFFDVHPLLLKVYLELKSSEMFSDIQNVSVELFDVLSLSFNSISSLFQISYWRQIKRPCHLGELCSIFLSQTAYFPPFQSFL